MIHWFLLTLVAMVFWGITGLTQKLSTNHISAQFSYLGFTLAFIPVALVILAGFPVELGFGRGIVVLGVAGGVLNGLGTLSSFAAFESGGKASIVVPIIYLYPLVTVIGGLLLLNEHLSAAHWAGVGLAPVAAWLLSKE
jgi:transporter family protein